MKYIFVSILRSKALQKSVNCVLFGGVAMMLLLSNLAEAQGVTSDEQGARWVLGGTYAQSNLETNSERNGNTYLGASSEKKRVATYLPNMTLIFGWGPSEIKSRQKKGYLEGVTHSGVPVAVLESQISKGNIFERDEQDVVVHAVHRACRSTACNSWLEVTPGMYSIKHEDVNFIEIQDNKELSASYWKSEFETMERDGFLTKVKDRIHPRLKIYDGYARELSVPCGGKRFRDPDFSISKEEWEGPPSEWGKNSGAWSLVALKILGLGEVDLEDGNYVGRLLAEIEPGHLVRDENNKVVKEDGHPKRIIRKDLAYDFTVFAYRDSDQESGVFRFAVLSQEVRCAFSDSGARPQMRFVENAKLYYDGSDPDEDMDPMRALEMIKLPKQFKDSSAQEVFRKKQYIPRVFFYSINNASTYRKIFHEIAASVKEPSAVANIIARLNASCSAKNRSSCVTLAGGN